METLTFNACKHLDFDDHYTAKKEPMQFNGEIKVRWNRPVIDETYPNLVQFCKKRGRLNKEYSCLCKDTAACNDYIDFKHTVTLNEK
jgi:hypothetical protein